MGKCEDILMEKEKDIAFLKYNLQELKTNFQGKQEVDSLKAKNENIGIKMENLVLKNELLEKKINSFEKQMLVSKKSLEDKSSFTSEVNKTGNKLNTLNDEVKRLSEQINLMKDNQKDINNAMEKVDNLKGHVTNIENILFCDSSNGCTDILIKWKLQNYQYYFDIGEHVFSPIFLTQIKGYCFKLLVAWSGEKKENLGLYLKICRGSNYDKPIEPFKMPFSLEMVDNNGNIFSKIVPLTQIETLREKQFTLLPGQNESGGGGYLKFLIMPDLNNYILNDMLSIQCRLTPS